jgi:hypothetical protein
MGPGRVRPGPIVYEAVSRTGCRGDGARRATLS